MTTPVLYSGHEASIPRADVSELVLGVLQTCRPDRQGCFPLPEFEVIHRNLTTAFPGIAAIAEQAFGPGWATAAPGRTIFSYDVPVHVEVEGNRVVRVSVRDDAPIGDNPVFIAGDRAAFEAAICIARTADHWPAWQFG